jgi:hypothetical protein
MCIMHLPCPGIQVVNLQRRRYTIKFCGPVVPCFNKLKARPSGCDGTRMQWRTLHVRLQLPELFLPINN